MLRLPITGYEGAYEIQEDGKVFSLDRAVLGKDGVTYPFKAKELKAHPNKDIEYSQVSLWKNNISTWHYVHRLVAIAFIPNPENKKEVNHLNGDRRDNRVQNLEWCTRQENAVHAIQTGLKIYTNRLTRDEFIECLAAVIEGESYASLSERVPYQVPFLSTKLRQIAKEENLEHLLDESLYQQKIMRARVNGASAYR
jgi:hypothetical protein